MIRLIALIALLAAGPLAAAGEAAEQPTRNLISLSVSASEEVDSDLLVVRMSAQHEAPRQSAAANRVNEDMAWALAAARKVPAVEAQTLDYRTDPVYEERRLRAWRTQQALRLESTDRDALTALLGTLQERLAIESVGYEVSPAVREAAEERLIDAAIERFSARAGRVARDFDRAGYGIVSVDVGTGGRRPPPAPYAGRALTMQAEVADPSIEAGRQTVTVTVGGTIELTTD